MRATLAKPLVLMLGIALYGNAEAAPLQAEGELLDLELEALLDIPVTVASARTEALRDTPVVVSRIDAEEARRYGLRTLAEWLSLLPGVVVQDSAIGTEAVMVRGLVEGFNQKVLFLLDGVPYWQPSHGDIPLAGIPLELIQHVELIRGPGGVLFGTNATGGVINVVTRRDTSREVAASAGTHSRWRGEGYWYAGEPGGRGLSLAVSSSAGPDYLGAFTARPVPASFPAGTPSDGDVRRDKRQTSAFLAWRDERGGLRWHGFESEAQGLAAAATLLNVSRLRYRGQQVAADHRVEWGDRHALRAEVDWTAYTLEIPTDRQIGGLVDAVQTFDDAAGDNQRLRGGLHWTLRLADDRYLQAGLERELRRHGEYRVFERPSGRLLGQQMAPDSSGETAAYAQVDWGFGDWRAVLGLRRVGFGDFSTATLPRGSVLWKASERQTWRLVFAEGYNVPTPIQRFVNVAPNALVGNPTLRPEDVRNTEFGWSWQGDGQSLGLTAYRMNTENAIRRIRPAGANTVTFINLPVFTRHGVEAEWRVRRNGWQAYASAHWQREGNTTADEFSAFAPRWQSSIGLSRASGAHEWGSSLRHIGPRAAADAIHLLSLQYSYRRGPWRFEIGLDNVLGDDAQHADVQDLVAERLVQGAPSANGLILGLRRAF